MTAWSAPAPAEKYSLDDYKRAQDNLREAGEIVKPYGVIVMLEFMHGSTFVGTLPTSLNLTRETAHPNVRSMFDFHHFRAGLSKFDDLDLIRPGGQPFACDAGRAGFALQIQPATMEIQQRNWACTVGGFMNWYAWVGACFGNEPTTGHKEKQRETKFA